MRNTLLSIIAATIYALVCAAIATPARADDDLKTFGAYPAPDAMYGEIRALARDFPGMVEIIEYGKSVRGRPLLAVKISSATSTATPRPAAVVAAGIHGNEWIGNRTAMAVARRILEGRASEPWIAALLDKMDFFILPCINPDGYFKTAEWAADPKMPSRVSRKNARGVDINRNFPLPGERTVHVEMAGSNDPDSERYTGPAPYSEPESAAVRDFFASHTTIFAAVDLHSNWGTIFPPKCNSARCEARFRKMCAAASEKQPRFKYPCVMNRHVDSFSGEMEDALFYDFGVMAVCWEVFTQSAGMEQAARTSHPFWSFNPEDIALWTGNEQDAILAALAAAFDITGGAPLPADQRKVEK